MNLRNAINLLPLQSRDNNNQAPTTWAAKTLLSDVYITMAGWPLKEENYYAEAAKTAKDIIEYSRLGFSASPSITVKSKLPSTIIGKPCSSFKV